MNSSQHKLLYYSNSHFLNSSRIFHFCYLLAYFRFHLCFYLKGMYLSTFMLTFVYALEAYVRTKDQLMSRGTTYDNNNEPVSCVYVHCFLTFIHHSF